MAPDRGPTILRDSVTASNPEDRFSSGEDANTIQDLLEEDANLPQNFTLRGVLVGLVIGIVICFSNTYFGLQTGWISGMSMPASLIGFAFFKSLRNLRLPFSPVENVFLQSVAGSVGTMPLGCGFVGVIPALEFLLKTEENGPLNLSLWKLIIWAVGICLFGVVFAVPLRKEVIIREKLKFPSGTATALLIGVLHDSGTNKSIANQDSIMRRLSSEHIDDERSSLIQDREENSRSEIEHSETGEPSFDAHNDVVGNWQSGIRLMAWAFAGSAAYTLISYFVPQLRNIAVFGLALGRDWLWTLNPSPAYIGQGIIMGPSTTFHMLLGAIIGWGILSPLAKWKGWAPGPVSDWETGSKGWIVWISLAIMLADSIISLGWLLLRPLITCVQQYGPIAIENVRTGNWRAAINYKSYQPSPSGYEEVPVAILNKTISSITAGPDEDAPPSQLVSTRAVIFWGILSILLYFASTQIVFPHILDFASLLLALALSLLLSIMGIRALGETDLNPVSGISKLTQLVFAVITPRSNPNAVTINLVAGAISESGAIQAGDLMQDLKCGHLLGASPAAQFYGQIVGSLVGAVASAAVYKLYTSVYAIPGPQFQVPTAYVWVFTARLVMGDGLPPMAWPVALGAAVLFALITALRTVGHTRWWRPWVPGGIAVAVGMYNTPSFTLARTVGGIVHWWWVGRAGRDETPAVVLASGLILGEGLCSIVNLVMASLGVPHL